MPDSLRILIVDDTVTYRNIITNAVSGIPGTEVVGTASNGKTALSRIEISSPDLVLLDVAIPVVDGIEIMQTIRGAFPDVDVVMLSSVDRGNANITMRALGIGALDFVPKPQAANPEENAAILRKSLAPIISLVRTRKYSRQARKLLMDAPVAPVAARAFSNFLTVSATPLPRPAKGNVPIERRVRKIDVVGIGVSTGGPNALQRIIPQIREKLRVPILTVQHMSPTFTQSLAERLDRNATIRVEEAKDGSPIEPGRMYLAPGGRHMMVRRDRIGIVDSPPVNDCRPSVDVLFNSMAAVYGANILAVVLTGMGRDGAAGVSAIRRKGGYCIVQDEATSVVWGMPQAVVEARDADEILPLDRIAQRIVEIVGQG